MAKQRKVTKRKVKVVTVKKCKNCGKLSKI